MFVIPIIAALLIPRSPIEAASLLGPFGGFDPRQSAAAPAAARADTMPGWLRRHLERLTAGSGRWITDNAAYRSEAEPNDAYGIDWEWGVGRQSVRGRLYGLRDGKEVGIFWEFRLFWHPGEQQALAYQFGAAGAVGMGPMTPTQNGVEMDQTFFWPDGSATRSRHESVLDGDQETTVSFDWLDGRWQKRRTYVWRRQL